MSPKKGTDDGAPFPDKEAVRAFVHDSPTPVNKREIARAFHLKGQDRTALRVLLRELEKEGAIVKNASRSYEAPDALPSTTLIEIEGLDGDGELRAKPVAWHGKGPAPVIYVYDRKRGGRAPVEGDKVLAKLKRTGKKEYEARIIKERSEDEERTVGVFKPYKGGGYVYPTDKKIKHDFTIPPEYCEGLEAGDLVTVERIPTSSKYPRSKNPARIAEKLGKKDDPALISLIAIHSHGIPTQWPKAALKETDAMEVPPVSKTRADIRDIPLVTIDGEDARDFDDAVHAALDTHPKNEGGWVLTVAIADVSHYVTPGSALDKAAYERGNSTYFADRVVPMLPEKLSNDLCSLRPNVPRACMAVQMRIDKNAKLIGYKFFRGLMKSAARLTYEQVEDAHRGNPDDTTEPLLTPVIKPLYKAYSLLKHAREKRGALELDLPERKAIIEKGQIKAIVPRKRLDSHMLIEEFMILANVAAAHALEDKNAPCVYRAHDKPAADRLETTRDFLKDLGYSLPRTDHIQPRNINTILLKSADRPDKDLIHTVLLRTQSQAVYSPENIGHFGLALEKYAHFTSPIRRYADLLVHRSLAHSYSMGSGGLTEHETENLHDICDHISATERRSMLAERDVMDRFTAQFLSGQVGHIFAGKISSVTRFGLFIMLDETGADGIVPMRSLPNDYYIHDEKRHALVGKHTGRSFRLSDPVSVRLIEADAMKGSTVFELVEGEDRPESDPPRRQKHRQDHRRRDKKAYKKQKDKRKRRNN